MQWFTAEEFKKVKRRWLQSGSWVTVEVKHDRGPGRPIVYRHDFGTNRKADQFFLRHGCRCVKKAGGDAPYDAAYAWVGGDDKTLLEDFLTIWSEEAGKVARSRYNGLMRDTL